MGRKRKNKKKYAEVSSVTNHKAPVKLKSLNSDSMSFIVPIGVYTKIMSWMRRAGNDECSGFGSSYFDASINSFVIEDAWLLKQDENSPTETTLDPESIGKLEFELHRRNDLKGELNWWWHSHVNMGCFWSSTDMDTIRELGYNGMIAATVFNKKGEYRSAMMRKIEFCGNEYEHFIDEIPTTFPYQQTEEEQTKWNKEFDDNVIKKIVPATHHRPTGVGFGSYNYNKERTVGSTKTTDFIGDLDWNAPRTFIPGEAPTFHPGTNPRVCPYVSPDEQYIFVPGHYAWVPDEQWDYAKKEYRVVPVKTRDWRTSDWHHVGDLVNDYDLIHFIMCNVDDYPEIFNPTTPHGIAADELEQCKNDAADEYLHTSTQISMEI